jgi:hypothetical protein
MTSKPDSTPDSSETELRDELDRIYHHAYEVGVAGYSDALLRMDIDYFMQRIARHRQAAVDANSSIETYAEGFQAGRAELLDELAREAKLYQTNGVSIEYVPLEIIEQLIAAKRSTS